MDTRKTTEIRERTQISANAFNTAAIRNHTRVPAKQQKYMNNRDRTRIPAKIHDHPQVKIYVSTSFETAKMRDRA